MASLLEKMADAPLFFCTMTKHVVCCYCVEVVFPQLEYYLSTHATFQFLDNHISMLQSIPGHSFVMIRTTQQLIIYILFL